MKIDLNKTRTPISHFNRILALALISVSAQAGTLYWDGNGTGASGGPPPTSGLGGAGTWDSGTTANWWNTDSSAYQLWNAPDGQDIADFRGTGGAVTVSGTVNVTNINILVSSYSFTGGTVAFKGTPSIMDVNNVSVASAGFASDATGSLRVNSTGSTTTSSASGGVITFIGTNNLTSFEMALNAATTPLLLDHVAGFGPASSTVKLTQGVLNLNSKSYNAWPTELAGATIRTRFTPSTWNGATTLSADSGLLGSGGNVLNFSSTATINLNASTLSLNSGTASGVINLNGVISGTGNLVTSSNRVGSTAANALGIGTVRLAAANTFSGTATTTPNIGTLALTNVNALQNATLDTGASAGSQAVTFIIPGNNTYNLGALTGSDNLAIGGNTISVGSKAGDTTFSAAITGSGGSLTKVGSDALNLAGTNTYTGSTTVSNGTLNTTTANTGAGSYSVADTATLGVSIAAVGQTLNMSSLTLGASTLNITLGANNPTTPVITNSGALTLNGTVTVNVPGGASLIGSDITLLAYGSDGLGTFTAGTLPSVSGYTTILTNDTSAKRLKLIFQVVGGGGTITATPTNFPTAVATIYGTNSSPTSVSVSGTGLTADIIATAPTGLEISSDGTTFGDNATFAESGGTASGTLYAQLKNNAPVGAYNAQTVILTSPGAATLGVATTSSGNTVTPKALVVDTNSVAAQNKLYDGNTSATVTASLLASEAFGSGTSDDGQPYSGDDVSVEVTGSTFASPAVSNGIPVTAGTFALSGAAAGNYSLTLPTGLSLSANITAPFSIVKNSATDFLNSGSSWVGGSAPAAFDVAVWDDQFGASPLTNGIAASLSVYGIVCSNNMGADYTILAGGSLTIGTLGFDMSIANKDFTIQANPINVGASQTWDVNTGRTLLLKNSTFNFGTNTLVINSTAGGGKVVFPNTLNGSGNWTIGNGATVQFTAGAFPANTTTVNTGGVMDMQANNLGASAAINLNGTGIGGGGALISSSGSGSVSGPAVTLQTSSAIGGAGNLTVSKGITGVGGAGLTKVGSGTLALPGTNTYSGPTAITNGTLNTTTRSMGAGSYAVSDSATLGVSIGSEGQTLNMSSLALGTSTLNITLGNNNPTATVMAAAGALTLTGPVSVNVLGGANLTNTPIVLLSYGSGGAGTFTPGTLPSVSGYTTILTNDTSAKQLKLVFNAVAPPPASITNTLVGNQLVLNWPDGQGWKLQAQTNSLNTGLGTNWSTITGATPPYTNTINPADPSVFYRLTYP